MPTYRIYVLDQTNHIRSYKVAECYSDSEAIAAAEELRKEHPWIEIWCGDRMVRQWRPPANDDWCPG